MLLQINICATYRTPTLTLLLSVSVGSIYYKFTTQSIPACTLYILLSNVPIEPHLPLDQGPLATI